MKLYKSFEWNCVDGVMQKCARKDVVIMHIVFFKNTNIYYEDYIRRELENNEKA